MIHLTKLKLLWILVFTGIVASGHVPQHDHMKDALDDMSYHFNGPGVHFDQTFYHDLITCFRKFDDATLYGSQVAAWKGIADYWKSNATNTDYLGRPDPWGHSSPALEGDLPPFDEYYNRPNVSFGRYGILTYEPCNYVSNIAYYHSVTKMCRYPWSTSPEMQKNQHKAMATLAVGSAFMHQSYTFVGARFDNIMIAIISYLGHQMMIQNLPDKSPLLTELQGNRRSMNSTALMNNFTETLATRPVAEWGRVMDQGDFPHDYFTNFGAMACNIVAFIFPGFITKPLIQVIAIFTLPAQTPPEERKWLLEEYLPEIVRATRGNRIPIFQRFDLWLKLMGVLTKLIYAFFFQEQYVPIPGFQTHPIIFIGGLLVPTVYDFADLLTGFEQSDRNVNNSKDLYPGQSHCKQDQGHSVWHEVSANGLLDLVYLCDHMNSLVLKYF